MSFSFVAKWLLMRPVLKKLIDEAEEEMVDQASNIILLGWAGMVFLLFLIMRR